MGVVLASVALAATTVGLGGAAFADPGSPRGDGGNFAGPGTGSGLNLNKGQEAAYCNGHSALVTTGPPAHITC